MSMKEDSVLSRLIQDQGFINLADAYAPNPIFEGNGSYSQLLAQKYEKIQKSEFLVPVLGIQGTGKSCLLNALLMDDLVLPVDADETTCIPVEIRYGRANDGEIHIYLEESNEPKVTRSVKELETYVHNRYNPGNERKVSKIVVYKNDELLSDNLVLVDLPGIGSLTSQNVKTTMDYVERLSAAVFLLRTVPPITRSEQIFLSSVWPKLTTAWFIQNQWNDERRDEVEEGKEHNLQVLSKIASRYQTGGNIDIKVINVYQALNAKLQNDMHSYTESGLGPFREYLTEVAKSWRKILETEFRQSILSLVDIIKKKIETKREEFSLSLVDLQNKYREEEQEYEQRFQSNKKQIREIQDQIDTYKSELYDLAAQESKTQMENLRSEMRRIIGGGITDGQLLNKAFQETSEQITEETMENISLRLLEIQKTLSVALQNLEIKDNFGEFRTNGEFMRESKIKLEKLLPPILSVGSVPLGIKVGTLIGGPLGAIVGIGISLIVSWLGSKAKSSVSARRQKIAVEDLEEPLRKFRDNIKLIIVQTADQCFENITHALECFQDAQHQALKEESESHRKTLVEYETNHQQTLTAIEAEYRKIQSYEEVLNGYKRETA